MAIRSWLERNQLRACTPGLFDGGSNCVTATAVHDATAYVLEPSIFITFCRHHPDLLLRLLTELSRRVRQTSEFIDLVTVGSVRQRLARVLLDLADECGTCRFNLPRSQAKIALCIGTVREVVFRRLKQLQSEGILHFRGSEIVVDDVAGLQTVAGARMGSEHIFGPNATPSIPAYIAPHAAEIGEHNRCVEICRTRCRLLETATRPRNAGGATRVFSNRFSITLYPIRPDFAPPQFGRVEPQ